mgnify:CR=1 FL=1
MKPRYEIVWDGTPTTSRYLWDGFLPPAEPMPLRTRHHATVEDVALVLACVRDTTDGETASDIAKASGYTVDRVRSALGKLLRAGRIRAEHVPCGPRRYIVRYHVT